MKTCPACRKSIDIEATKCPYCQTLFDPEAMREGRREARKRTERKLILVVVIVIAAIIWLVRPGNVERLAEWSVEADSGQTPR